MKEWPLLPATLNQIETMTGSRAIDDDQRTRIDVIQARARGLAVEFVKLSQPSRLQAIALTKLEDALMYMTKAIATGE